MTVKELLNVYSGTRVIVHAQDNETGMYDIDYMRPLSERKMSGWCWKLLSTHFLPVKVKMAEVDMFDILKRASDDEAILLVWAMPF